MGYTLRSPKLIISSSSISYDANGGSGAPVTASGVQFSASATVSATVPTRSGYTFGGWNTAANGSGTSYASGASIVMPANNVSLYAQWTATVQTVTYNANGGSAAPSTSSVATDATATVSSTLPVRNGYTFLWLEHRRKWFWHCLQLEWNGVVARNIHHE